MCKFFCNFFSFFFIFLHFCVFFAIKYAIKHKKSGRVLTTRTASLKIVKPLKFMAQNKNAAKVQQNLHISKFYADILRDFCERKLRLVVLPVSACPYVLRAVHIYKRLGRYLVILV